MTAKTQTLPVGNQWMKWIFVAALVGVGLYSHYHFADQPLVVKLLGWLLLAGFALWIASTTEAGQRGLVFVTEAKQELKKIVWPTRQETGQASLLVLVMVTLCSLFFWAVDSILLRLVAWITGFRA